MYSSISVDYWGKILWKNYKILLSKEVDMFKDQRIQYCYGINYPQFNL